MTIEQSEAIQAARIAFELCEELNSMDGYYASDRVHFEAGDQLGPWGHAKRVALTVLTRAFNERVADFVAEKIWETNEANRIDDFVSEALQEFALETIDKGKEK